jgi:hypothetical protein
LLGSSSDVCQTWRSMRTAAFPREMLRDASFRMLRGIYLARYKEQEEVNNEGRGEDKAEAEK